VQKIPGAEGGRTRALIACAGYTVPNDFAGLSIAQGWVSGCGSSKAWAGY